MGFNPVNLQNHHSKTIRSPLKISIVQVYAPTSTATDETMTDLYGQLQYGTRLTKTFWLWETGMHKLGNHKSSPVKSNQIEYWKVWIGR